MKRAFIFFSYTDFFKHLSPISGPCCMFQEKWQILWMEQMPQLAKACNYLCSYLTSLLSPWQGIQDQKSC